MLKFIADREDDGPPPNAPTVNYKPPANLYAFPPSNAVYSPPGDARKPISVSSYLPPPSGPSNYPIYPGPVPVSMPVSGLNTQADNSGSPGDMVANNGNGEINVGPSDDDDKDMDNPDRPSDDTQLIDKPPPNFMPSKKPDFPSLSFLDDHDAHEHHEHDHDHHHHHHPHDEQIFDHPPFSYDDSLKHLHGFDAFPGTALSIQEIIEVANAVCFSACLIMKFHSNNGFSTYFTPTNS